MPISSFARLSIVTRGWLLAAALALVAPACTHPREIPQGDPAARDFDLALTAVEQVLVEQGYALRDRTNPLKFTSKWVDDGASLRSVSVVVQDHAMAPALKVRVTLASPIDNESTSSDLHFEHLGRRWRIDASRVDEARDERQRLGALIVSRWKDLRREAIREE